MNEIFSIQRFWNLSREHWTRNWRKGLIIILLSGLGMILSLIWFEITSIYSPGKYDQVQWNVFNIGLLILCFTTGLLWFNRLGDKSQKLNYFLQPTSPIEKTLHTFLWCVVFSIILYIILFSIVNPGIYLWAVLFEKNLYYKSLPDVNANFLPPFLYQPFKSIDSSWLSSILLLQSLSLALMLFFKKFAMMKAILMLVILIVFYNSAQAKLGDLFLVPQNWESIEQNLYKINNSQFGEYFVVKSSSWIKHWNEYKLIPVWLFLWVAIYYLIKEQEV